MPGLHPNGSLGILREDELDRDIAGVQGTYGWSVQSAAVTFSSGLTFAYASAAAGDYTLNSVLGAAITGSTVVLGTQDPSLPRVDRIVTTVAGAVSVVPGTPAALTATSGPVPTALTALQLELARIFVPASGTALSSASITDRRHPLFSPFFDSERTAFRANRRLVGAYVAQQQNGTLTTQAPVGLGFWQAGITGDGISAVTGEPVMKFSVSSTGTAWTQFGVTSATSANTLSPSHSPRMLTRLLLPAASANVTSFLAGFIDANSLTANGAYLRIATTGDVFFVTRSAGAETATDLGVLSRTTVLGFEIETADAGVTWVCRNQAGTALATSTTNVPVAATGLCPGVIAVTATGAIPWGVASIALEATTA